MFKRYMKIFALCLIICLMIPIFTILSKSAAVSNVEAENHTDLPDQTGSNLNVETTSGATNTVPPTETPAITPPAPSPTKKPAETPPPETKAPAQKPSSEVIPTPSPLIPAKVPDGIDLNRPIVALTFDDGPNTIITNRILDLLEQQGQKATFFVVGERINSGKARDTLKRAVSLGCEIGSHTFNHSRLTNASIAEIEKQISQTDAVIKGAISTSTNLLRPTYGAFNDHVKANVNKSLIMWSVDTEDWRSRDAKTIIEKALKEIRNGDIILMHDLYGSTAEACETLIPKLVEQGYQFVTVSELFACRDITMYTRTVYSKAR